MAGLYAGPLATTALHETLVAVARGLGDLPPLVRRAKTYEEMSADERARFNGANGFGRDLTEEAKRAMDEWATAGRSGVQAVRSARARWPVPSERVVTKPAKELEQAQHTERVKEPEMPGLESSAAGHHGPGHASPHVDAAAGVPPRKQQTSACWSMSISKHCA